MYLLPSRHNSATSQFAYSSQNKQLKTSNDPPPTPLSSSPSTPAPTRLTMADIDTSSSCDLSDLGIQLKGCHSTFPSPSPLPPTSPSAGESTTVSSLAPRSLGMLRYRRFASSRTPPCSVLSLALVLHRLLDPLRPSVSRRAVCAVCSFPSTDRKPSPAPRRQSSDRGSSCITPRIFKTVLNNNQL